LSGLLEERKEVVDESEVTEVVPLNFLLDISERCSPGFVAE